MPIRTASMLRRIAFASLLGSSPGLANADDPPPPTPPGHHERKLDEVKPLPPFEIPDDPPPHEGAMINLPYVIEPPDILVVEVLEALPGRPISGERLVRPDGKISLGFYGEVEVAGLTPTQAKVKLIRHMQNFILDEVLGLSRFVTTSPPEESPRMPRIPQGGRNPFHLEELDIPARRPADPTAPAPPAEPAPVPEAAPKDPVAPAAARPRPTANRGPARRRPGGVSLVSGPAQEKGPFGNRPDPSLPLNAPRPKVRGPIPATPPGSLERIDEAMPPPEVPGPALPGQVPPGAQPAEVMTPDGDEMPAGQWESVAPEDSDRVFVDVSAYNTKVYYVTGDVGRPGRIPFTGRETVLDALNYSGNPLATADEGNIHLRRPARGSKPARDFKIDLKAIRDGDASANLQVFPGDRLVVGRDPVVQASNDLDRQAAPFSTILNQMFLYGSATRAVAASNPLDYSVRLRLGGRTYTIQPDEPAPAADARREAQVKEFVEVWSSILARNGGKPLDEKAFREALIRKLGPAPGSRPE